MIAPPASAFLSSPRPCADGPSRTLPGAIIAAGLPNVQSRFGAGQPRLTFDEACALL